MTFLSWRTRVSSFRSQRHLHGRLWTLGCTIFGVQRSFWMKGLSNIFHNSITLLTFAAPPAGTPLNFERGFRLQPQQQVTLGGPMGNSAENCSAGNVGAPSQPLVMSGFPLRAPTVSHYSPYSPSRFHIDKRCQHRCSWKCFSIALIFVTVLLVAMLVYFASKWTAFATLNHSI